MQQRKSLFIGTQDPGLFTGVPFESEILLSETCLVCMGKSKMYASSQTAARPEFTGAENKLQQKEH